MDFRNQKGLIDDHKLGRTRFVVVGAGAIGSNVVVALSKMGATQITVYDFDTIEVHNLANQFYPKNQLGKAKVLALKEIAADYGDCEITAINEPWTPDNAIEADVVISAVDNMEVRKAVWDYYKPQPVVLVCSVDEHSQQRSVGVPRLFLDGRMGPFVYKVYGVDTTNMAAVKRYEDSLHSQEEGSQEKCGHKSIIYTVAQVGAQIVSQVRSFIMDEQYRPTEVIGDCFNDEIYKQYDVERKLEVMEAEPDEVEQEGVTKVVQAV